MADQDKAPMIAGPGSGKPQTDINTILAQSDLRNLQKTLTEDFQKSFSELNRNVEKSLDILEASTKTVGGFGKQLNETVDLLSKGNVAVKEFIDNLQKSNITSKESLALNSQKLVKDKEALTEEVEDSTVSENPVNTADLEALVSNQLDSQNKLSINIKSLENTIETMPATIKGIIESEAAPSTIINTPTVFENTVTNIPQEPEATEENIKKDSSDSLDTISTDLADTYIEIMNQTSLLSDVKNQLTTLADVIDQNNTLASKSVIVESSKLASEPESAQNTTLETPSGLTEYESNTLNLLRDILEHTKDTARIGELLSQKISTKDKTQQKNEKKQPELDPNANGSKFGQFIRNLSKTSDTAYRALKLYETLKVDKTAVKNSKKDDNKDALKSSTIDQSETSPLVEKAQSTVVAEHRSAVTTDTRPQALSTRDNNVSDATDSILKTPSIAETAPSENTAAAEIRKLTNIVQQIANSQNTSPESDSNRLALTTTLKSSNDQDLAINNISNSLSTLTSTTESIKNTLATYFNEDNINKRCNQYATAAAAAIVNSLPTPPITEENDRSFLETKDWLTR